MGGWPSRSWSGRRMPARSPCFSSGISTRSSAIRGSSCRTAPTWSGSSATSSGDERAPLGPHRYLRRPLRAHRLRRPAVAASCDDAQRSLAIRRAIARTEPTASPRPPARAGSQTRSARRSRSSSRRSSSRIGSTGTCPSSRPRTMRELDEPGSDAPAPAPPRAARRRPRRVERRAGLRIRLRGPDSCGVGALETLSARTDVTASIPYELARAADALGSTVPTSPLAAGTIEELPRPLVRPLPAPLDHLERSLFVDSAPAGRRSRVRSRSSKALGCGARSSCSRASSCG